MQLTNISKNTLLAQRAEWANSFLTRLVGLLNRKSLDKGEALILDPSNSIHSFFMRFTFDAVFLDKDFKVIAILPFFRPFRISRIYSNAAVTVELPAGTIHKTQTAIGDQIRVS